MTLVQKFFASFLIAGVAIVALPFISHAADTCVFTQSLQLDDENESVRCLQQYLNSAGFTVAASGVGSSGNETDQFGPLTESAVKEWQSAQGLTYIDGIWGKESRKKYYEVVASSLGVATASQNANDNAVNNASSQSAVVTPSSVDPQDEKTRNLIEKVLKTIEKADDAIEEADDYGLNTNDAEQYYNSARNEILDAVLAYFTGDYDRALVRAEDAQVSADESLDESGLDDHNSIEDQIEDLKDDLDEAWNDYDDAKDDGASVNSIKNYLDQAEDTLDEADDAFDDGDYDEAEDLIDDARDYLDDAQDDLDDVDKEVKAEKAIDDADDAIDDARDAIEDADDGGEEVDRSEDLLDDAEDALEDAEEAFFDEDYNDALEYADEAEDLARDAVQAIGDE